MMKQKQYDNNYAWKSAMQIVLTAFSIVILLLIIGMCAYVIFNHDEYSDKIVNFAAAGLFVQILGLMIWLWKTVIKGV